MLLVLSFFFSMNFEKFDVLSIAFDIFMTSDDTVFSKRIKPVCTVTMKLNFPKISLLALKVFILNYLFRFNVHVILNHSAKTNSY